MSSIDIFPWNENFNTGIQKVDEQHEKLVQLLNKLAGYVAYKAERPELNLVLDQLADYAVYHFETEEGIWHEHLPNDALELEHNAVHNSFVEAVLRSKAKVSSESEDRLIEELLSFLTSWLASHILENDRYMAAVVQCIQAGMPLEKAKASAHEKMSGGNRVLIDLILSIYASLSTNTLHLMRELSNRKEQEEQIKRYSAQLEKTFMQTVAVLTTVGEMRDPYTAGHEKRVARIALAIGAEMGMDEHRLKGLEVACLVHDIGNVSIPAEIMVKPARLTPIEYKMIRTHSQAGYEVLKDIDFPWPVAEIALQHHERLDGSGYPRGLKGMEILLEAWILAVADTVEAMGSHRPYRASLGIDRALAEIERGRGTVYDPLVADSCLRIFREKGFQLQD